ncbi:MAG: hypothetical protein JRG90_02765 [Deltaproteobacteria bacterium]|nr:hypothetical protein [Deltaproteobacteria bacterium]MBW2666377.1 hypothetical protein [Deltaproteobacteria bacterium]
MFQRFRISVRPAVVIGALLCLAFPPLWDGWFPVLEGDPVVVQLTRLRPKAEFEIPAGTIRAQRKATPGVSAEQLLVFEFPLERTGRYSIYGISSNRTAQPIALQVNGRPTSAMAFFQRTGSKRANFERYRIATGVSFVAGRNIVSLSGPSDRTMLLELRHEIPLGAFRWVLLFTAAAMALGLRRLVVANLVLPPSFRVAVAIALFATGLVAFPVGLAKISGGTLAPLGQKDPVKTLRLRLMEEHFASAGRHSEGDGKFRVFLMGDSTHYWSLPRTKRMLPRLQQALAKRGHGDFEVSGVSGGALNGVDFYLLMSRVVRERPDLVVIPVGTRSFSEYWLYNEGYRFHEMDHYPTFAELLRARNLSVAGREFSVVGWGLRSLDARFFDGRVAHLLRGARVWFKGERERVAYLITRRLFGPEALILHTAPPEYERWITAVADDHPLFEAYRLINNLAHRNGIEVLYYSEPANETAQRRKGRALNLEQNFAVIERAISGSPGVHFLRLAGDNPPGMFSDDIDHLTRAGIETVAGALADEIAEMRAGGAPAPQRAP